MSKFNDAYLTDAGVKLLTRSIAENFKIEFVKMVIGDGVYEDDDKAKEKIVKMSELKSKRKECGFGYIGITENDTVMLKAVIENTDVDEGYRITEIGIVAKKSGDATSNGILYSLAVAEEADFLPTKTTPISYIQEYYTKIHNAENVSINVKMGAYATAEDLNEVMYPEYDTAEDLEALTSGERLEKAFGKIKKAIDIFIDHILLKASKTVLGHVKVSDSETVTDSTGLALAATEKNEEIPGTIASKVRALDEGLTNHKSSTDHDGRYLKKAEVVNNNTTTAAGYALDARQANPNVAGSLGAQINALNNNLINKIYPVGSIYMSVSNVSPASFLGGTWEQIQNRFLLAAGSNYAAGTTGGEAAHVLSTAEMPLHGHGVSITSDDMSNNHTHAIDLNTGTVSADHGHAAMVSGDGVHTHIMRIRRDNSVGGGVDRIGNANAYDTEQTSTMESAGYHTHDVRLGGITQNHTHRVTGSTGAASTGHTHRVTGNTGAAGSGAAHNNMPPYLAVYMWKRTA